MLPDKMSFDTAFVQVGENLTRGLIRDGSLANQVIGASSISGCDPVLGDEDAVFGFLYEGIYRFGFALDDLSAKLDARN